MKGLLEEINVGYLAAKFWRGKICDGRNPFNEGFGVSIYMNSMYKQSLGEPWKSPKHQYL